MPDQLVQPLVASFPETMTPAPPTPTEIDIVADWDPQQLADFSIKTKGEFDPKTWAKNNPDRMADPGTEAKIADAHALLVSRGVKGFWQDLDTAQAFVNLVKTIPSMVKWTYRAGELATVGTLKTIGRNPEKLRESLDLPKPTPEEIETQRKEDIEFQKKGAELASATELGVTGLVELAKKGSRGIGRAAGLLKSPLDMDPEERRQLLWGDVGEARYMDKVSEGKGVVTSVLLGGVVSDLEKSGNKVDPATVSELAAGDPVTFLAFPGGFKVVTASGKVVAKVANRAMAVNLVTELRAAQRAAASAVAKEGEAVATLNAVKEAGAATSPLTAPILTEAGSAANVASQEAAGALARQEAAAQAVAESTRAQLALRAGEATRKVVEPISRGVAKAREAVGNITDRGTEIALGIAPAVTAAAARTTSAVGEFAASFFPPMVTPKIVRRSYEIAGKVAGQQAGVAKSLFTGAQETFSPALRLTTDLAKGAPDIAAGAAKGYLLFDIPLAAVTSETPADTAAMPTFGAFFGALGAAPRAASRVVTGQTIAPRAWGSKTPLRDYGNFPALDAANKFALELQNNPAVNQRLSALREFLKPANAEMYLLDKTKPDPATGRTQFEDAIRRFLPGLTEAEYTERGLQQGVAINARAADGTVKKILLVSELSAAPHEAIHPFQDVLGEAAMRKINDLVYSEYAPIWDLIGQHYVEQFLDGGAKAFAERYQQNGLNWQDALVDINRGSESRQSMTREEIDGAANEYVANELSAEIGDAILKHTGPSLMQNQSLPGKLARILGKTLVGFGIEPFQGIRTEGQGLPLRSRTVEGVREALQTGIEDLKVEQRRPDILGMPERTARPTETAPRTTPTGPGTPEAEATAAEALIETLPANPPVITGGRSGREILADVAAAIRSRGGLVVDYRHAPGDPASAPAVSREARRAIIEFHRTAPEEVRSLFAQLFFPDRVIRTGKGLQVQGWSPEVFASNAQKLAKALDDAGRTDLVPYEIADGTFTSQGWFDLYNDVEFFVKNQMEGRTGAGEPLVVPASVTAEGFFPPPEGTGGAGSVLIFNQRRADIISALFGIKLPSSPRIGNVFPRNIAGQRVAEATKPGRTAIPVEPRAPFSGKRAEEMGIAGEQIKEVNPFRQELASEKINPNFVEAIQHLNLDRIAEVSPAPAGTPEFRAREFTLQAGFQPKAEATIREIRELTPEEISLGNARGFGITERAKEIGRELTTPEDLQALQQERQNYIDQIKDLRTQIEQTSGPEKMALYAEWGVLGAKAQIMREAYEVATNTGSMAEGGVKFQPKTEAGKALAEKGFELQEFRDPETNLNFLRFQRPERPTISEPRSQGQRGVEAGYIEYYVPEGGKTAEVSFVYVPPEFRGQGHAETLYREMLTRLQEQGIESVGGAVVSPEPLRIRANLLGTPELERRNEYVTRVSNRVPPDVQFQPSKKEHAIKEAATRGITSGRIYTGRHHGETHSAFISAEGSQAADRVQYEDGFVTNSGEFLSRSQALERALEMKQVSKEDATLMRETWGGAEAVDFSEMRTDQGASFQPSTKQREQIGTGIPEVQKLANDFLKSIGKTPTPVRNRPLDKSLMDKIADFYDSAEHDPENPEVKRAYQALSDETLDQWQAIVDSGVTIDPWTKPGQPYRDTSEVIEDIRKNKHLYFFPTKTGGTLPADHPMLADSGIQGRSLNDIFRAVHDFFGHAKNGFEFGPRGEFNAFLAHSDMYSEEALPALAAETTGQNAWMYYGKRWEVEKVPFPERPFAPQKATILPEALLTAIFAPRSKRREPQPLGRVPTLGALAADVSSRQRFQPQREDQPRILGQTTTLGAVASNVSSRNRFTDEAFPTAVDSIREGRADGATFTAEGKVWEPPADPVDIVSLASVNVPRSELTAEKVRESVAPFSRLLDHPSVVAGVFAFDRSPNATASIDVNAVVPQEYRANTVKFAKANDQISIWDASKFEEVKTGGKGETVLRTPEQIEAVLDDLTGGRPVRFAPKEEEVDYSKYNVSTSRRATKNKPTVWVLPDGSIKEIDSGFHEQDLAANATVYNKQFGTKFTKTADLEARADALNAGFVRIRYNPRDGAMHIEAAADRWDRKKSVVLDHVLDHEADVDRLYLNLLDKNSEAVATLARNVFQETNKEQAIREAFQELKPSDQPRTRREPGLIERARALPGSFQPKQIEEGLPGLDLPKPVLSPAARAQMSLADLRKMFPEAAIPRAIGEAVSSDIVGSPLYKRSGSESAAVDAFAKRLVDFARENSDNPSYQAGLKWYSDFTPRLKKEFGKDADLFAELLAATSPNTNPEVNFGYAYDALLSLREGRFKKIIPKFEEGLEKIADNSWEDYYNRDLKAGKVAAPPENPTPATFMAHWIDKFDLKPKQSNGKLYGQHSLPVLQVFARRWMELNAGPKTRNFVENLLGKSDEATIDVWADRTMRWAGYEGFQDRWRILPENQASVSDRDFAFAQKVFRKAAEEMNVKPSALQGALWFAEKQRWGDNGWSRLNLGNFQTELDKAPLLKRGFSQRLKTTEATKKTRPREQMELVEPRY